MPPTALPAGLEVFQGQLIKMGDSHGSFGVQNFHPKSEGAKLPPQKGSRLPCNGVQVHRSLQESPRGAAAFPGCFPKLELSCWNKHLQSHRSGLQNCFNPQAAAPRALLSPSMCSGLGIICWYVLRAGELRV